MNVVANRHVVLVGLMGVGKTTVGRSLAARLGRPFLDSDELIEQQQGRTVREIFAADGEATFREIETKVLVDSLASPELAVIAAAGGVVLSPANRTALKHSRARVVWLLADVSLLLERVKNGVHRPLLDNDPEATLKARYRDREALYREVADAIVTVDGRSASEVIEAILR